MEFDIKIYDVTPTIALIKGSITFKELISTGLVENNPVDIELCIENILHDAIVTHLKNNGYEVVSNVCGKYTQVTHYQDLINMLINYQLHFEIPYNCKKIGLTTILVGQHLNIGIRRV